MKLNKRTMNHTITITLAGSKTRKNCCQKGVFMSQNSTLLWRESSQLSVKNLGFLAKVSWIEDKYVFFMKNKKFKGTTYKLFSILQSIK